MLDKATGRPTPVSPRDASVRKHFYSLDVDEGRRDPAVEEVLSLIESVAAPLVARVEKGEFPVGTDRLELALFLAVCKARTPVWREQLSSVIEQMRTAMVAKSYRLDPAAAQRAFADSEFAMTPEQIEEFRQTFVGDLEQGRLGIEMPKNAMIKLFLDGAFNSSWTLFTLDWTVVRLEETVDEFIIADTPVSLYDAAPAIPGGGVGFLSSPNTQTFVPLGPSFGLLLEANADVFGWTYENLDRLHEMSDEDRVKAVKDREGGWAESEATSALGLELNLRSYANAERFIFGSQKAASDIQAARRSHARRLASLAPRGPHMHIVEDDPGSPSGLRIAKTFKPRPRR